MKEILKRLKSPVVITQIITIIGALVVTIIPEISDSVKTIVDALAIIVSVFAGVNNPTDRNNF